MRRRISLLVLAALLVLPAVAPVRAAQPVASEPPAEPTLPIESPEPEATPVEAEPTVAPTPDPTAEPTETVEPAAAPVEPAAPRTVEPAAPRTVEPSSTDDAHGRPDVTDRYIVVLAGDADTSAVVERMGHQKGVKAERTFGRAIRGFTARLDAQQRKALESDPNVVAIVPDEVIEIAAQTTPTGVARIFTKSNTIAKINGVDERVNADVAIVDTGIQSNHPDLNVVGGYNCSTSNRAAWRDVQGHGTHVAGTVGALDNTTGVVGVAPGARLWAVKILNDDGYGLLSWYVCGLDWILAQRDPNDASRPLIEAVNMSVVKDGKDDQNCGNTNGDILHKAICRVTGGGITVVAAAGNDRKSAATRIPATYAEVITVSALADTDGKAGGLGGNRCYSWGGYDKDDTFADFSNYGSDVDIIAPGKCIWSTKPGSTYGYSSGTSMATPAVTGAAALYKASRPAATPAEVREALLYLANTGWKTSTDPDSYHEKLLDVSKLGALGTFSLSSPTPGLIGEDGGATSVSVRINRSSTFFERVRLSVSGAPTGWTARMDRSSVMGWTATSALVNVTVPDGTPAGDYELTVTGTNQGRASTTTATVTVGSDIPTAFAPSSARAVTGVALNATSSATKVAWPAATDLSSAITAYQFQYSRDGASWTGTQQVSGSTLTALKNLVVGSTYKFRVRARDAAGNWSTWAPTAAAYTVRHANDRSGALVYAGTWSKSYSTNATSGTLTSSDRNGANVRYTFTGRSISVIAPRSPTRSWLEVRINGAYVTKLSLYASSYRSRQVIFARSWTTSATRTIELRVVTSSLRKVASLDGFVVYK